MIIIALFYNNLKMSLMRTYTSLFQVMKLLEHFIRMRTYTPHINWWWYCAKNLCQKSLIATT